ncbi:MAG: flagellar basal body-associated FliL family protein [Deltaproteobacteria bacterium]|nr:flagellar basal body-associated FliL family protein [Deltaproteobacteria bacterium]
MAKDDLDEKENEEQAQEDKPKSKKKFFIIIGVVVLVLILGGVGAFLALSPKAEVATEEGGEEAKTEEAASEGEGAETEAAGALFSLDTFIVNLQIKGSFLKTDIQLEMKSSEDMAKAEEAVPRLRDIIIQVLSSKMSSEILTNEGKLKLKDEIKQNINDILGEEKVIEVYFTEFIIQ